MRIPTWRLALTGGAIVILVAVGVGLVAASTSAPAAPVAPAAAAPSGSPGPGGPAGFLRQRLGTHLGRLAGERLLARHLVHATVTVTDKDGKLVTVQLDHGTLASIGSGSLSISEAGGSTVSVATDADTVVRLGGGAGKGTLGDLRVGDEIFVQSRIDGGATLAKHVLRVPATTAG